MYDSKWNRFCKWCIQKRLKLEEITIPLVADFFEELFTIDNLHPTTIEGYRAALRKPILHLTKLDISDSPGISDLISNFYLERPKGTRDFPRWDLALVLRMLKGPPFEPIKQCEMKYLNWKTVFLLALASGARRGELHALDVSTLIHTKNWRTIVIKPNPRFMAKNFNPKSGKGAFEGILIESLDDVTGRDKDSDYDLCPVRALKIYVQRTKDIRGDANQLFVTRKLQKVKGAHKNTISNWIKQTVLLAYKKVGESEENLRLFRIKAHEARALAASLALYNNVALEDILECCRWASTNTFMSHYLRNMSSTESSINQLLPLRVAGATLRR